MANPQPRLYGELASFRGSWDSAGRATIEAQDLPAQLVPRREQIEAAIRAVADLPFTDPIPPLAGMDVYVGSNDVLVCTSRTDDEERTQIEIHTAPDGSVERRVRRQLGLVEETHYAWRKVDAGLVLERRLRLDPVRPEDQIVHEVHWAGHGIDLRPESVTLRLPGKLPHGADFVFTYDGHSERGQHVR